jgi:RecB family exonuclease
MTRAHISWTRYGRPAAEALRGAIAAAKGDEPLAPVTVVVSANHVGVASRRLLASGVLGATCGRGTGLVGVSFLTPYRLAELLAAGRLASTGRRPVSTPVLGAALRAALAQDPGLFGPVAQHPATETALVGSYRELRDVSPAALNAVAAAGDRAHEVVRLHRTAHTHLVESWYDEQDLMAAAVDALAAREPGPELGSVVVYLPQLLSRHAAALLAEVARHRPVAIIAGTTGDETADAEIVTSLQRMGLMPPPRPALTPAAVVHADHTTILSASDPDDEVRAAVRRVVDAMRSGTPLDRIALLHASPVPYARLAHEHLAAAGITSNGAAVLPLTARAAARTLLQLLALPARNFRRQDVFAWLAGAPLLHRGRWAPAAAWERLSRDAAVVAGRDQWDRFLATLAERLRADAQGLAADPDQPAWKSERSGAEAARALELRSFVLGLIDDLSGAASAPRAWGEHARWASERLETLLGNGDRRDTWPEAERKAAERLALALDRLAALEGVEGPVELAVFARTLQLELEADLGRVGRLGEGVLVGAIGMGIALDLDLVVLLGLAEGTFPATPHDDSLLPDHERARAGGELPLRTQRVQREHRELLATLAGSRSQLLCLPRGDLRRSSERVPSRWLLELASALSGTRWWSADLEMAKVPWVHHVPSFDAGLRTLSFPATEQEHHLRSLLAQLSAAGPGVLAAVPDPVLASGAEVIQARRSRRFTRFDGNLSSLKVPSPLDRTMSSSRLEQWATCPFAYLLHHLLGVESVENPEEQLRMTPIDHGNLVHEALERFITGVLARPVDQQPGPDDPWSAIDRHALVTVGEALCDEYEARGRSGRAVFWHRDRRRIRADLQRFLCADDDRRRRDRTRPLAAELEFGFKKSALAPVSIELPDGRTLWFLGKADRVDRSDDGTIHVVDYKTGSASSYGRLNEENPDLRGRKLQLAVYGAAALQHHAEPGAGVKAEYWFVSDRGGFREIGFRITDDVLERVGRTLGTLVAGIEEGVFPPHPTASSTSNSWRVECAYCDPDALGVTELRRHWDRKRHDPALAPYAELAEPLEQIEVVDAPDLSCDGGPSSRGVGS